MTDGAVMDRQWEGAKLDLKETAAQEVFLAAEDRRTQADHAAETGKQTKKKKDEKAKADAAYQEAARAKQTISMHKTMNPDSLNEADSKREVVD
jgi:hypothetical protein